MQRGGTGISCRADGEGSKYINPAFNSPEVRDMLYPVLPMSVFRQGLVAGSV